MESLQTLKDFLSKPFDEHSLAMTSKSSSLLSFNASNNTIHIWIGTLELLLI